MIAPQPTPQPQAWRSPPRRRRRCQSHRRPSTGGIRCGQCFFLWLLPADWNAHANQRQQHASLAFSVVVWAPRARCSTARWTPSTLTSSVLPVRPMQLIKEICEMLVGHQYACRDARQAPI
jgi:hypothetical protein